MPDASGGYLMIPTKLIRRGIHAHSSVLERSVSPTDLKSINAVQATPWQINPDVFAVMAEAWNAQIALPSLATEALPDLPARMGDDVWTGLDDDDKLAHRKRLSELHAARGSISSRRQALLDKLMVAGELQDEPAIWFPHTRDFRGRIYPEVAAGPSPQGDDPGKALLRFAAGVPLGPTGLYWLLIRAANCAGQDKLALVDRAAWSLDHLEDIKLAAQDPLGAGKDFWCQADDPWQLLATCFELFEATAMDNPDGYLSHLPIPLDGTCNGLQHLSAMGLDEVGAMATNLTPGVDRRDIYEDIAKIVRGIVEADAAAGKVEAMAWMGRVTRKVVKRAVMTTPLTA